MKLANFRPLVVLAGCVMLTISSWLLAWWCSLIWFGVLAVGLILSKQPAQFKIVVATVCALTIFHVFIKANFSEMSLALPQNPDVGCRGAILSYTRWYLRCFLSETNAALVFAMLFGDKSGVGFVLNGHLTTAGVLHVLTVSGLHVHLLASAFFWLLRVCRVPQRAQVYVLAPLLIFYAYLCCWHYPVLRAVIMALVFAVAKNHCYVADPLSVLALAAVIILVLFPEALISASFGLSFACMLGINLYYRPLLKCLHVKVVAMYVAVTLGMLPLLVNYFGTISVLGLLTNIVLVPLLVFVCYLGWFAVVTFVGGVVLYVAAPILQVVRWLVTGIGSLSWATVSVTSTVPAIFVYFTALILGSRFIFLKAKIKYPLVAVLLSVYLVLCVVV